MKTKKKIFIDAGSNRGQAFDHFSKKYSLEKFDYYLIEPNKRCIDKLRKKASGKNVTIINKALSTSNGPRPLYGKNKNDLTNMSLGLSLFNRHNTIWYTPHELETVECIDVSDLLRDVSEKYEKIYMKIDIESSEYEVLEKIIEDGTYKKIKRIWVEWHDKYWKEERESLQKRQKKIIKFLQSHDIQITNWH